MKPVEVSLDKVDRRILNLIQDEFPIDSRPYKVIGERAGITEEEVIARLNRLVENDIVRRIGGIFDSRSIGYRGTLCAVAVEPDRLEKVVSIINDYSEITHNYLRDHDYNVWFTVLAQTKNDIDAILNEIKINTGIGEILELPAEKYYKIKVKFNVGEGNHTQ